jgi:hypothetical protein
MRLRRPALLAAALALLAAPAARAEDPGRWELVRVSEIPLLYYQGITNDPARQLFYSGHLGIFRTDAELNETARNPDAIPPAVKQAEGYNHIGDLDWDPAEGGRVLLPMECYYPGTPNNGNTCPRTGQIGTGSIAVADAATLQWRYYVKLDQAEIKKAMWVETTPDGSFWTQEGRDLLRYSLADVNQANAWTPGPDGGTGPAVKPVARLRDAVPPSGITGATFHAGRLYVAGQGAEEGGELFQVHSIDLADGSRRLEAERRIVGESEGLTTVQALGGFLQWQVMPYNESGPPTYGIENGALLTFAERGGAGTAPGAGAPGAPPGLGTAVRRPFVEVLSRHLRHTLRRGLAVRMGCQAPCSIVLRFTARRGGRTRTVARNQYFLRRADRQRVRLRLRRSAKRAVRAAARRGLTLRATAIDGAGRHALPPVRVRLGG